LQTYNERGEKTAWRDCSSDEETGLLHRKKQQAAACLELLSQKSQALCKKGKVPHHPLAGSKEGSNPKVKSSGKRGRSPEHGQDLVGVRICKMFNGEDYFGSVASYSKASAEGDDEVDLWHIIYDDGDEEDYDLEELRKRRTRYKNKAALDPKPASEGTR
jgi:hypothetical protein